MLSGRYYLKFLLILISTIFTGCMVGPDFHSPKPPPVNKYTECPQPKKTVSAPKAGKAGKPQYFMAGRDVPGEWWYLFHSQQINNLITNGLANSPNLAAAKAALRNARENLYAQIGSSLYPAVNGQFTGERQRVPGAAFGINTFPSVTYNLFNAQVNISYTLDIFGGARRQIEALCAQVYYEQYELYAAYLTLTSNIVTTAITVASLRAQIAATEDLIQLQTSQLDIIQKQFQLGGASRADVLTQEAQVAQTKATLPPLKQTLIQNIHALSVLVGEFPCEDNIPKFDLDKLVLPGELPISIPCRLVRQRPDVAASEALLHAASAQVGVATANMYPQINLTGYYGREDNVLSSIYLPRNAAWNFGGSFLQPIFDGGALRAKKRAAIAAYDQALAQYKQIVLQAFQNVADTLRALQHDAKTLQDQKNAEIAAYNSFKLSSEQYRLGAVTYLYLLTAERTYQQARISRIQAEASRYTDTAALFQALGGGWWNKDKCFLAEKV